jgi:ADP-ribose pyrophosphatase YjhB (NUDIX family)
MCGTAFIPKEVFGRVRLACPGCDYVYFIDPKVAVGVVAERLGHILLTKRNHEPKMGRWSFPSGFVEAGEDVRLAAIREAKEETSIDVEIETLLGVYQEAGSRVVYLAFSALAGAGEPIPDAESMDVRFFPLESIPPLAFDHDSDILTAWRARH